MAEYDKNLAVAGTHTLETKGLRKRYGLHQNNIFYIRQLRLLDLLLQ